MTGVSLVERVCSYNKAISDPNRMKIIKIVGSQGSNAMNISAIANVLGISQPATTNHLKIMESVGLLTRERVGNSVYYALNHEAVADYQELMLHAFAHCATPCDYGFQCETCPVKETCM